MQAACVAVHSAFSPGTGLLCFRVLAALMVCTQVLGSVRSVAGHTMLTCVAEVSWMMYAASLTFSESSGLEKGPPEFKHPGMCWMYISMSSEAARIHMFPTIALLCGEADDPAKMLPTVPVLSSAM